MNGEEYVIWQGKKYVLIQGNVDGLVTIAPIGGGQSMDVPADEVEEVNHE